MPPDGAVKPAPFEVHLENFSGPFDLLLGLITRHKLDITEVALAQVTDEFIAAVRAAEDSANPWPLGQISEFLVVAATLLDLKAARLLPGELDDTEDFELLEARDLLFAKLLQYRAYKEVAKDLETRLADQARRRPRAVSLEPQLAAMLPELVWVVEPEQLAAIAGAVLAPKPVATVSLEHLHGAKVSVREEAHVLVDRLRRSGSATFRSLVGGSELVVVVARFLALLELFREGQVSFDQVEPLGELTVRWTGAADGTVDVDDDYDEAAAIAAPAEEDR
jgi:segregation and condensation protein A